MVTGKEKQHCWWTTEKTTAPVHTTLSHWIWSGFNPESLLPSIYSFRVCDECKAALL